ncbi:ABC transporter substrate-binding protein [Paenibacillus wulumuqiensis]|uniref:ABC transporter substrate-binding protein n=1 Tax=Paenibacillus wulumuqiensis TaxID=1567107 RepID=UPI001F295368|nr:extracellular solute-binding protein [Paenibacillus wulumuqiensis]
MNIWKISIAVLLVAALLAGCGSKDEQAAPSQPARNANGELEGNLVVWTFFDQVEDMAAQFMKDNPKVKVEVKTFPGDDYQTKLLTALQSGQNVPDVFDLERSYIGKFIDSKYLTDLSAMGAEDLVANYVPYVQALGRASDNTIRAVSDHSSPGGFWYIRENAKKYLGTDDPDQISEMVGSWDKVIALGKKVEQQSKGQVHLISNSGDLFDIEAYNTEPWVKEGKLNIDPKWEQYYNIQREINDNNVDAKLSFMSAGWGNALNAGSVVLTTMPAWASFMIDNDNGSAKGKYGVARTPEGYYNGGTYRGIYQESPNKELAYEFIKYIASEKWQQHNLETTGNMPGNAKVYEKNMKSFTSEFTGDQKVMEVYYDVVKDLPAIQPDKYSEEILGTWRKVAKEGITNHTDYATVVANFTKQVQNAFPEIQTQ